MKINIYIFLLAVLVFGCGKAKKESQPSKEIDQKIFTEAIAQLADENEQKISEAQNKLISAKTEAVPSLIEALSDTNPLIQERSALILGEIGDDQAVKPLATALSTNENPVRASAKKSLLMIKSEKVKQEAAQLLKDENFQVRTLAAQIFKELNDLDTVPILIDGLNEKHGGVRNAIYDAIVSFGEPVIDILLEQLKTAQTPSEKRLLIVALGRTKNTKVTEPLIEILQGEIPGLKNAAACALGEFKDERTIEPLLELLKDTSAPVRACAAKSLGNQEDLRALDPLLEMMKTEKIDHARAMAAYGLGKLKDDKALKVLIAGTKDESRSVRYHSVAALASFTSPTIIAPLIEAFADDDIRNHAIISLIKVGEPAVKPLIAALRTNKNPSIRTASAQTLGRLGNKSALKPIIDYLEVCDETVAHQVSVALRTLSGQNLGTDVKAWREWLEQNPV